MWIRVGDFDCFVTTVDEGDFSWHFNGEQYVITERKVFESFSSPRYSLMIREVDRLMPKLKEARKAFLDRFTPAGSKANVD